MSTLARRGEEEEEEEENDDDDDDDDIDKWRDEKLEELRFLQ